MKTNIKYSIFNLLFSSQLRAEGDMKKATFTMAAVDILNIIMDPIFIYVLNLGIKGAAYATVLSTFLVFRVMHI